MLRRREVGALDDVAVATEISQATRMLWERRDSERWPKMSLISQINIPRGAK